MSAKRVALISPCGWGNLGDAAILDSVIYNLRRRYQGIDFVGLTLNPTDTRVRHGIDSMSLCGCSKQDYGVAISSVLLPAIDVAPTEVDDSTSAKVAESEPAAQRFDGLRTRLKQADILVSTVKFLRGLKNRISPLAEEARHIQASYRLLGDIDVVLVAGGGQLDDLWGGAFGHPYVLFRWALLARLKRVPFAMLSVGVGQLTSRTSRFFVRQAISLSAYRSYRDSGSRDLLAFVKQAAADRVIPDLAFAHPIATGDYSSAGRTVGISPISYKGPKSWPDSDTTYFESYVSAMAEIVNGLVLRGYGVTLFCSVRGDEYVIDEIIERLPESAKRLVECPSIETVDDLARVLSSVSVVVASRLHSLLLSALTGRPLVALSFERKVKDLMQTMLAADYCLPIENFQVSVVLDMVGERYKNFSTDSESIRKLVSRQARRVCKQYDGIAI